jgi:hypothetical protein
MTNPRYTPEFVQEVKNAYYVNKAFYEFNHWIKKSANLSDDDLADINRKVLDIVKLLPLNQDQIMCLQEFLSDPEKLQHNPKYNLDEIGKQFNLNYHQVIRVIYYLGKDK